MLRLLPLLPLLLASLPWVAGPALAAESAPVSSKRLVATLVSDTDAVAPGQPFRLGLRLQMAPGWHTYWQNPGDAGQPADLQLALPTGTTAGPLQWPTPERMAEGTIATYGYTGDLLLPLTVTPGAGAQRITATATWLVCERICVPEEGSFVLDLPAGTPAPSAEAGLFARAEARLPRPSPFAASVAPDGTLSLSGAGLSAQAVKDAWFLPEAGDAISHGAAQTVTVRDGSVRIKLTPEAGFAAGGPLKGTVVLQDPRGEQSFLAVQAARGPATPDGGVGLETGRLLLFAALGGLLLNLMPCVFPVLAMKAMALARGAVGGRRAMRAQAVSYTAGVLVAFVALGGALLAARGMGAAAGWGFQFQSPVFVAGMAAVLFLVGLNLSGVFEVRASAAGAGQRLAGQGGHAGSFFTGALAVLVATPCTAPFMGAAIAGALAAPASETLLIFLAMGGGMALPYLLLALAPGWARVLPRPGAWMDVFRGALAFPMYAAAAWLVWVLSLQAGPSGVLAGLAGLLLAGLGAWAFGVAQRAGGRGRRLGQAVALACAAGAAAVLAGVVAAPPAAAQAGGEAYTPARLAELRAQGRPVFVDMTAAWCVTCLVNEKVALSPERVRDAFARKGVTYLRGDWTRGDPAITAFLREHGRDGVPLYVLYPPGQGAPTVLPQILTEAEVLGRVEGLSAGL